MLSTAEPIPVDFFLSYPSTDCGNAERLVDQHGEALRFCPGAQAWFAWNGRYWRAGEGSAVQLAKKTVRSIHMEKRQLVNRLASSQAEARSEDLDLVSRRVRSLDKWATRSEAANRIMAMLRMARSDPRLEVSEDDFDRNELLLNLPNGTMDLSTRQFRAPRSADLLTKTAGAIYDPNSKCPRWEKFLVEVFEPHPEIIPFIQRAVGYSLTADTREECIFVLAGRGRNGKSTFLGVLHQLMGEYAGVAEMETFMASHGRALREDIADMHGRRFVSSQEPMMDGRMAEATLKWLSGGDRLKARRLYEHTQEFQPSHKLWMAVNRMPKLCATDGAVWSRLRVIPFDISFAKTGDHNLKTQLRTEISGILNWALEGCALWLLEGLKSIDCINEAGENCRTLAGAVA